MPLTTISANIDYSFFTIPLDNSLISIKIWLLKHPFSLDGIKYPLSMFKILPKNLKNIVYNRLFTKFNFNYKEFKRKQEQEDLLKQQEDLLNTEIIDMKPLGLESNIIKLKNFSKMKRINKLRKFTKSNFLKVSYFKKNKKNKKIFKREKLINFSKKDFMYYLENFFFYLLCKKQSFFLFFLRKSIGVFNNLKLFNNYDYFLLYNTERSKINPFVQ